LKQSSGITDKNKIAFLKFYYFSKAGFWVNPAKHGTARNEECDDLGVLISINVSFRQACMKGDRKGTMIG